MSGGSKSAAVENLTQDVPIESFVDADHPSRSTPSVGEPA